MAFSENLSSLDHWNFRQLVNDSWNSEAFSRDNETLTKALQKSLSGVSESITDYQDPYLNLIKSDPSPTGSGSDIDSSSKLRNPKLSGKIVKRKSRATKRNPTTFITADPANFRQMVQQVTGIQFGGNSHVSVNNNNVLKPEPHRLGDYRLPGNNTLDTSTFLIGTNTQNNTNQHQNISKGGSTSRTAVMEGDAGLGLVDAYQSFPTLESWRLM